MPRGTVIASDAFTRADGTLGANWTEINIASTNFGISGNQVICSSSDGGPAAYWAGGGSFTNDHYSILQAAAPNGVFNGGSNYTPGVACRMAGLNATRSYYRFYFVNEGGGDKATFLVKVINGVPANLTSYTGGVTTVNLPWANDDYLEIECEGTTIRGYRQVAGVSTLVLSGTDASLSTGIPGMAASGTTDGFPSLDNWSAGAMVGSLTLAVTEGTLSFSGQNVPLDIPCSVTEATITFTGQSININGDGIGVVEGILTFSGQQVDLLANSAVTVAVNEGAATLTASDVVFQFSTPWDEILLTITGQDVALQAGLPVTLAVTEGTATFAGQDVVLQLDEDFILVVTEGQVTFTGQDVLFSLAGNLLLQVDVGAALFSGQDVGTNPSITLPAQSSPRQKRRKTPVRVQFGR